MDQQTPEGGPAASSETPAESPPATPAETPPAMPAEGPPAMPAEALPAPAPTAPPPVAWNASVPATASGGRVTGLAKGASLILIIFGALLSLAGLLSIGGGAIIGSAGTGADIPELAVAFGAAAVVFGVIFLIIGVIAILAGIGAWRGNGAGRVIGIVYGVLFTLSSLAGLSGAQGGNIALPIILLLLFGYVALVLLFRWKAPVTA